MNWHIFTIGKPRLAFAREGVDEYARRMKPFVAVKLEAVKTPDLLRQRSEGMLRIVLDERGEQLTSRELAQQITAWEHTGTKSVAILIGGADGHMDALRQSADRIWSLSRLTLQHELALVVLYEQLYRAYSIKAGLPYHRD